MKRLSALIILVIIFVFSNSYAINTQTQDTLKVGKYYKITYINNEVEIGKLASVDPVWINLRTPTRVIKIDRGTIKSIELTEMKISELELEDIKKQEEEDVTKNTKFALWVTPGIGIFDSGSNIGGYTYSADVTAMFGKIGFLTLRISKNVDADKTNRYINEIGLMLGYISKTRWGYMSVGTGPGVIQINDYNSRYLTFGAPFEVQAMLTPAQYFGIGGSLNANLNLKKPFVGISINLQIGKLW